MSDVPVSSSSSSVPPSFSCSAADGAAAASAPPAMPGGIVEKPLEDLYTPPIPADLIKAILNGSCVAFIGAGFSAAAKLPSWGDLLLSVIDTAARACLLPESLVAFLTETVGQAVKTGKSEQYDLVSQLMEDKLGAATVERILKSHLQMPKDLPDAMRQRLQWLDAIPFRAILTTNFDAFLLGLTPGHPDRPFYDVLRPAVDNRARLRFSVDQVVRKMVDSDESAAVQSGGSSGGTGATTSSLCHREGRPIIKLHGDLESANTLVWTRTGYRRLLHFTPGYTNFVRSVLATSTVLYLGFSFSDGYLNELRGEVLSMLRSTSSSFADGGGAAGGGGQFFGRAAAASIPRSPSAAASAVAAAVAAVSATARGATASAAMEEAALYGETAPIGYALVHDKSSYESDFFRRHEGVQIITWPAHMPGRATDYEGFDRILKSIFHQTSYSHHIGRLIEGKRILVIERKCPPSPSASAASASADSSRAKALSMPGSALGGAGGGGLVRSISSTADSGAQSASYITAILQEVGKKYADQQRKNGKVGTAAPGGGGGSLTVEFHGSRPASLERTPLCSEGVLDAVNTWEDGVACIEAALDGDQKPYDVVLTIFGEDKDPGGKNHVWLRFVSAMRSLPPKAQAPVIVYSANYNTFNRRKFVLKHGCFAFCYSLQMTVDALAHLLDDDDEVAAAEIKATIAKALESMFAAAQSAKDAMHAYE